ncbi:hypothetical protein Taro_038222 [Colocasia esculenta]|uniref:Uncharacterized protein n=1 Tax=Colocasia esculenta TaxID=4460 RepID=A0A843W2U0_COLES|nr:hypothetical protein [Colocasia esculenta]
MAVAARASPAAKSIPPPSSASDLISVGEFASGFAWCQWVSVRHRIPETVGILMRDGKGERGRKGEKEGGLPEKGGEEGRKSRSPPEEGEGEGRTGARPSEREILNHLFFSFFFLPCIQYLNR